MPRGYIAQMLAENERISLITRQHWFVLARNITLEIILTLIILGLGLALAPFLIPFLTPIYLIVPFLVALVPVAGMVRDFLIWYNRDYIITNRRVIQINGIFNKNVIDSSLEKVNDVKMTQSFWGRMFNFGDVEILTASEQGVNLFRIIGEPVRFKTSMLNAKAELENGQFAAHTAGAAPDVPSMIAELDDLRRRGVLTEAEFQAKKAELLKKI